LGAAAYYLLILSMWVVAVMVTVASFTSAEKHKKYPPSTESGCKIYSHSNSTCRQMMYIIFYVCHFLPRFRVLSVRYSNLSVFTQKNPITALTVFSN
jgi:hypothetical protein